MAKRAADLYHEDFPELVAELTYLGATDAILAEGFGVGVGIVRQWRKQFPEFDAAVNKARFDADTKVARSVYEAAVGYTYEEEITKLVTDKETGELTIQQMTVTRHVRPNPTVGLRWLEKRREEWREDAPTSALSDVAAIIQAITDTSRGLPSGNNPPETRIIEHDPEPTRVKR